MKHSDGAISALAFPQREVFYLEASASIFKDLLIPYNLMIYLHIDLKAGFTIHANYQSGKNKSYQAPTQDI